MSKQIRVSVVGVTGYTGNESVRLLARRPDVQILELEGRSAAGQPVLQIFPSLAPLDLKIVEKLEKPEEADYIFLCLPHHASAGRAAELLESAPQARIIDFSADFRLHDRATYEKWYGEHPAAGLLDQAVYGLPEIHLAQLEAKPRLVANPGCYPTCSILALAPALSGNPIIKPEIVINALSGTSGAGRGLKLNLHFSEMHDSASAYSLDGHRHMPEIRQELVGIYGSEELSVSFTPHLIPVSRGMLANCSASLLPEWVAENAGDLKGAVRRLYRQFYAGKEFVKVVETPPTTKEVFGTNYCFIYPTVDVYTNRLVVISVLDNMVKGSAGQAIQCMNIIEGLPETTGLNGLAIYP